jgi:hypothetical protein
MSVLTRAEKIEFLAEALNARAGLGLEIGPGLAPMFPRRLGYPTRFLEQRTAEESRALCERRGKATDNIEEIDFLLRRDIPLPDLVGRQTYDWAASSHVVEHIPDFIGHLHDISALLKPAGAYGLIVPDRNLCFDCLKPLSTLGNVIQQHLERATAAPLATVIDEYRYGAAPEGQSGGGWRYEEELQLHPKTEGLDAIREFLAQAQREPSYGHAWRFTPPSFASIFFDLVALELTDLRLTAIRPSGAVDFLVVLTKPGHRLPALTPAQVRPLLRGYRRPRYRITPELAAFSR